MFSFLEKVTVDLNCSRCLVLVVCFVVWLVLLCFVLLVFTRGAVVCFDYCFAVFLQVFSFWKK